MPAPRAARVDLSAQLDAFGPDLAALAAAAQDEDVVAIVVYLRVVSGVEPAVLDAFVHKHLGHHAEDIMSPGERIMEATKPHWLAVGRAEGRAEGRASLFLRLLTLRFGPVPADVERRVREAASDDLDRWSEQLLFAESLGAALR